MRKRLTKQLINERLESRQIVMLDDYVRQTVKARFQCKEGHVWSARPNNVLSGKGCPICGKASMANKQRFTADDINSRVESRGLALLGEYRGNNVQTEFQCSRGHRWETVPAVLLRGGGCPYCAGNIKLTKEEINSRIADRNIHLVGDYQGAHVVSLFQCKEGHTWEARPNNILHGKNCPHCARQFPLSKELINERLIDRSIWMVGDYLNSVTPTKFRCSLGHTWKASPGNVMSGTGCPECAGNGPLTADVVNDRVSSRNLVMLDKYINNSTKARFQCKEGHIWETAPANVLSGRGCPKCAERTTDNDVFYLWLAGNQQQVDLVDGEYLLKYGITSESRGDLRIKEIGYAWKIIPNILAMVKTNGPASWVENAVEVIGRKLTSEYAALDGWTEFRIVTEAELAFALEMADQAAQYKITWNNPVAHIKKFQLNQLTLDLK